jgi:hypothetical protein
VRYVGRLFRLAFLAPDIVEAIVEGRQPISLTAEAVTRNIEMPLKIRHVERRRANHSTCVLPAVVVSVLTVESSVPVSFDTRIKNPLAPPSLLLYSRSSVEPDMHWPEGIY